MNDIQLGADILGSDGEKIGVVDSLVVDPSSGSVRAIVVRKGFFFPTDRILPIDMLAGVGDGHVVVNATKENVEELREYLDTEYLVPPAGFYGAPGYMWTATQLYDSDLLVDEQIRERLPDALIVSRGTLVVDADGDEVGRITDLYSDDRAQVAGFKVEEGFFRHHEHYIPAHVVASADDVVVRLSVDKGTLEGLTGPEDARAVRPTITTPSE